MICYACKENKPEKALSYCVDDLKTYCLSPYACSGNHPSSLGRQMVNEKGLLRALKANYPREMAAIVEKYGQRAAGIRFSPSQLLFLLRYQYIRGTASLSETVTTALTELQLLLDDVMGADISRMHVNWTVKPMPGSVLDALGPPEGLKPEPEPEPAPLMPTPKEKEPEAEPEEETDGETFRFEV